MQKSFPITMKDVAELAKVSVSTVSHTINKTRFVSDVTRQRVLRAMAELGYHPNIIAQSLRRKRTNTVGLIISDITNPFFPEVVRGVEKQLIRAGYSIILANTDDDTEKERELVTLLYGKRVDGLIIVPSGRENKHIKFLVQQNVPVVLLDRKVEGLEVDTVLVDNCGGTKRLTEYLISLGHKRVGIIAGDINISTGRERLDGYVEALKKHSLFNDNLVKIGDFSQESGYSLTLELLSFSPPPTVILACNNLLGLGAMDALREKGIQIPQEMGIVIFDDLPWFRYLNPPLTVVAQPTFKMGEVAVKLLLERMRGRRKKPKQIVLKTKLILRESAGEALRRVPI